MPSSVSANSTIANKLKVFQQAELHDEYYKLVDVVTELKTACQQEQERRAKAVARVRRLEEIVAMKDRKIESLLHAKAVGSDHSHVVGAITQREMAQRDRQSNAMMQKLRHKIAQQSQVIASYEEAMQSLRSGIKSTNLMELEEERSQLVVELRHQHEQLACQRIEIDSQAKKIAELHHIDATYRQQIAKAQQESKRSVLEKHKLEQEIAFFKARVDQLQDKLTLEQRKRTYDREVAANAPAVQGHDLASPARASVLVSALEEMKALMKRECAASIQREKLKSPRAASKSPRPTSASTVAPAAAEPAPSSASPALAPTAPATPAHPPQRQTRPQSAGPTRPHRPVTSHLSAGGSSAVAANTASESRDEQCDLSLSAQRPPSPPTAVVTPGAIETNTLASAEDPESPQAPQEAPLSGSLQTQANRRPSADSSVSNKPQALVGSAGPSGSDTPDAQRHQDDSVPDSALALPTTTSSSTDTLESLEPSRSSSPSALDNVLQSSIANEALVSDSALSDGPGTATAQDDAAEKQSEPAQADLTIAGLHAAELHEELQIPEREQSSPTTETSDDDSSSLSTSRASSPDSDTSASVAPEDAATAEALSAATIAHELEALGLLKTDSQDSVLASAPGDSMYDSDFTENGNDSDAE